MAFVFNGSTRIIQCTSGTTAFTVTDLYSRWKEWAAIESNSGYLPAFKTIGGDEIDGAAGTAIPFYGFLINGWRIRPQEASHTLSVTGGILLVDGGGDPFINTQGTFRVAIKYSQPVQAIAISTTGSNSGGSTLTAEQVRLEMDNNSVRLATITDGVANLQTTAEEINDRIIAIQPGLSTSQATMLLEMYELLGLDPSKPLVVTGTHRSAGDIQQTIVSNSTQTIVQRT